MARRLKTMRVDLNFITLHRAASDGLMVIEVHGEAVFVQDRGARQVALQAGQKIGVGDTIMIGPGGEVTGHLMPAGTQVRLSGGAFGLAHGFVPPDAFSSNPGRENVPEILERLSRSDAGMVSDKTPPRTAFERAATAEFARLNLDRAAARRLPEHLARAWRVACVFVSDETMFVAMASFDVQRVRGLVELLHCPIEPYLVEEGVIEDLIAKTYGSVHA